MKRLAVIAAIFATVSLGACTQAKTAAPSSSTSPSPSGSRSASSPPSCSTTAKSDARAVAPHGGVMLLTAISTDSRHPCVDKVTFRFHQRSGTAGIVGYRIEYRTGPFTEDPSDKPLNVKGNAFLVLHLSPASSADLTAPTPSPLYPGPKTIDPAGMKHVVQIQDGGDFENVMTWIIGLDSKRPFEVVQSHHGADVDLQIQIH